MSYRSRRPRHTGRKRISNSVLAQCPLCFRVFRISLDKMKMPKHVIRLGATVPEQCLGIGAKVLPREYGDIHAKVVL